MDRTIHFGDDEADARYRIQDTSSTGGDFVLAEDLDGGTVLLEYDYSASEWVSRGPVNLNGNDITNAGSITTDTLEAKNINDNLLYASEYSGADADARLDAALADASSGDTVILEDATYTTDRTITAEIVLTSQKGITAASIDGATWTISSSNTTVRGLRGGSSSELIIDGSFSTVENIYNFLISANVDGVLLTSSHLLQITFASGTTSGLADGLVNSSVTDNGTNTVGDIS